VFRILLGKRTTEEYLSDQTFIFFSTHAFAKIRIPALQLFLSLKTIDLMPTHLDTFSTLSALEAGSQHQACISYSQTNQPKNSGLYNPPSPSLPAGTLDAETLLLMPLHVISGPFTKSDLLIYLDPPTKDTKQWKIFT
jgi:hypothetical protein